ncbi:MAG: SIR2 family protein [Pseudomonadota bacterium]
MLPDYIRGADKARIDQSFQTIQSALIDPSKRVGFLFGAGMSAAAGMMSSRDLGLKFVDAILPGAGDNLTDTDRDSLLDRYPFESIASAVAKVGNKDREVLVDILEDAFLFDGEPPEHLDLSVHREFARLVGLHNVADIFTTNFDKLLETSLGERAFTATQNTVISPRSSTIPIFHLHGLIEDDTYKITEDDIYAEKHHYAINAYKAALYACDVFVFVGYSMNDPDFRNAYLATQQEYRSRDQLAHKTTYFVMPIDTEEEYVLASSIWESRNAILLPMVSGDFFTRLKKGLGSETQARLREIIMKVKGIDNETLDELVSELKEILSVEDNETALRVLHDELESR